MNFYPINLNLDNKEVLIVGGGRVAYRKLKRLISVETKITLISPDLIDEIKDLIKNESLIYKKRKFLAQDIENQFLVIAATDSSLVNQEIAFLAHKENLLVNVVDNLELSNFTVPSVVKQGDLLLTVATGGNLPALSREVRKKLENEFGEEFVLFLELMAELRPLILEEIAEESQRRKLFRALADLKLIELLAIDEEKGLEEIKALLPARIVEKLNVS